MSSTGEIDDAIFKLTNNLKSSVERANINKFRSNSNMFLPLLETLRISSFEGAME